MDTFLKEIIQMHKMHKLCNKRNLLCSNTIIKILLTIVLIIIIYMVLEKRVLRTIKWILFPLYKGIILLHSIEIKSYFCRLEAINYFVAYVIIEWKTKLQLKVSENKVVILYTSKFMDTLKTNPQVKDPMKYKKLQKSLLWPSAGNHPINPFFYLENWLY